MQLNGNRCIEGTLRGYDQFVNLTLADVVDKTVTGTSAASNRDLGMVVRLAPCLKLHGRPGCDSPGVVCGCMAPPTFFLPRRCRIRPTMSLYVQSFPQYALCSLSSTQSLLTHCLLLAVLLRVCVLCGLWDPCEGRSLLSGWRAGLCACAWSPPF